MITAIGPKRSSSNAAIPGYAGELRRLEEESWARSAGQNLRTVGDCFGDDPLDIGGLALVDDRARPELSDRKGRRRRDPWPFLRGL